jgi:hypothetical protein
MRLGMTQTGNAELDWTPLPATVITVGEFVALLTTDTLPVTLPVAIGAKAIFSVADWLGAKIAPVATPEALNPAPEGTTLEIVTFEFPLFVSVTPSELVEPTFTFPKLRLVGFTTSSKVAGFTVSVAGLLVTFPAVLLTAAVNCAPVSELVVAGVV